MFIAGYIIAFFIGASLGFIGGGGSILTVPVLVYFLHVDPLLATTYSLFIVGCTSLAGGAEAYMKKLVDFQAVSLFGIPSILSIFIARHFILPAIPDMIGSFPKGNFLMLVFALLMLIAGVSMIFNRYDESKITATKPAQQSNKLLYLFLPGLFVGLVTGLLGAGGGFLIIPVLVLLMRVPMKIAIGTSLLIIAINASFGFVFSIGQYHFDWKLLLLFTALSVMGVFAGRQLSVKLKAQSLKKVFGWFVLLVGVYIIFKEVIA